MLSNKPLVTVLVPAYNHENFIEEAIESIITQSYKNIELIITNDGSLDKTNEKILSMEDKCKNRFVNFKYINRANKGLLMTLKEMEALINGKYMTLCYSDDIYLQNRISKQVSTLEENENYALCYGKMVGIDENSKIVKGEYKSKYSKSGFVFDQLLERNFIPAPTVMMRTDIFKSVGGYDLGFYYDDYPLWLKIAYDHPIKYIDESLVYYRTHGENVSSDILRTISFQEKVLLSWINERGFKRAIKKFYLRSFYNLAKCGVEHKIKTREYMLKSMPYSWYDPRFIKAFIRYLK
jgi:alpha-1,3-rhamnosyltransferase